MWVAASIGAHWNEVAQQANTTLDPRSLLSDHVFPCMVGVDYLLERGGLAEDGSRPRDEAMMPPLLRQGFLMEMRSALIGAGWFLSARGVHESMETPPVATVTAQWYTRAAENAKKAPSVVPKAWIASRQIEAGALLAQAAKAQSELTPKKDITVRAARMYKSVLAAIGYGITISPDVSKPALQEGLATCTNDMSLVHNMDAAEIKTTLKNTPQLDAFIVTPYAPMAQDSAPNTLKDTPTVPGISTALGSVAKNSMCLYPPAHTITLK